MTPPLHPIPAKWPTLNLPRWSDKPEPLRLLVERKAREAEEAKGIPAAHVIDAVRGK